MDKFIESFRLWQIQRLLDITFPVRSWVHGGRTWNFKPPCHWHAAGIRGDLAPRAARTCWGHPGTCHGHLLREPASATRGGDAPVHVYTSWPFCTHGGHFPSFWRPWIKGALLKIALKSITRGWKLRNGCCSLDLAGRDLGSKRVETCPQWTKTNRKVTWRKNKWSKHEHGDIEWSILITDLCHFSWLFISFFKTTCCIMLSFYLLLIKMIDLFNNCIHSVLTKILSLNYRAVTVHGLSPIQNKWNKKKRKEEKKTFREVELHFFLYVSSDPCSGEGT